MAISVHTPNEARSSEAVVAKHWELGDDESQAKSRLSLFPTRFADSRTHSETVVIEHRAFVRDCLVRCLVESHFPGEIFDFATVDDFLAAGNRPGTPAVLLLCTGKRPSVEVELDWSRLLSCSNFNTKIIILAEDDYASDVLAAIKGGVRGYIPMSENLNVAIEAIHLVRAGGVFIPASCLTNACRISPDPPRKRIESMFTSRQVAVIEAMLKGKSNKIIAYELEMAEATVKVHVRNIMRRLNARNRTEVAFLVNAMHGG